MLLATMLIVAILTQRGAIALDAALNALTDSRKYVQEYQALTYAEAGVGEVKGRLINSGPNVIKDPAATPDPLWSAYLVTSKTWQFSQDPDYNSSYKNYFPTATSQTNTTKTVNSVQTTIPYWAKIRYKREYDAELAGHTAVTPHYQDLDGDTARHTAANPGNIVYYGYPPGATTPVQFTTSATTSPVNEPVRLVKVYGQSGGVSKSIELELARSRGVLPPIVAALYAKGNVNFTAGKGSVGGNDNCDSNRQPAKAPVYTLMPFLTTGSAMFSGNPSIPQQGLTNIDIQGAVNQLKAGAAVLTADQSSTKFGSSEKYVTLYSNTFNPPNLYGLRLTKVAGYGTLLVDGDLHLDNNTRWYGLILVTGKLLLTGKSGEPVSIEGAVLAGSVDQLDTGLTIKYNHCTVEKAITSLAPSSVKVLRWRQDGMVSTTTPSTNSSLQPPGGLLNLM